jgi:hypothetical protein
MSRSKLRGTISSDDNAAGHERRQVDLADEPIASASYRRGVLPL